MLKDQEQAAEAAVQETIGPVQDPAVQALTAHLQRMADRGCSVGAHAGTYRFLLSGMVRDVRIEKAWAYFTIGNRGFRTETTADKEALLQGVTDVCLRCLFTIPEPEKSKDERKSAAASKPPIFPLSRYFARRVETVLSD